MGPRLELRRKNKRNKLQVFVIVIHEEAPDPGDSSLLGQTPVDIFPVPLSKKNKKTHNSPISQDQFSSH